MCLSRTIVRCRRVRYSCSVRENFQEAPSCEPLLLCRLLVRCVISEYTMQYLMGYNTHTKLCIKQVSGKKNTRGDEL